MFQEGQQIGVYTLIRRIGRGGFGEVWLAERRAKFVTTKVALKLPLDSQVDHDAIKQEAVLWEQASGHPNVLPIIDADEYDGQIVIVSEYAPDGSLHELLAKNGGALPIKRAVELALGILSGLEFLHSRQIIHRDLKPGNILLQGDTPRLADFGISRVMQTTSQSVSIAGTYFYMAPEAFDGKRNAKTDVWAVGVILFQMLAGGFPFPQSDLTALVGAIMTREPEPLPDNVPQDLREIVFKSLTKDAQNRYQTARQMREDLSDYLLTSSQRERIPAAKIIEVEMFPKAEMFPEVEFIPEPQTLIQAAKTAENDAPLTVEQSNVPYGRRLTLGFTVLLSILIAVAVSFSYRTSDPITNAVFANSNANSTANKMANTMTNKPANTMSNTIMSNNYNRPAANTMTSSTPATNIYRNNNTMMNTRPSSLSNMPMNRPMSNSMVSNRPMMNTNGRSMSNKP